MTVKDFIERAIQEQPLRLRALLPGYGCYKWPKHPPAKQFSHPDAGQRLLPVLLRPQPQHRAGLERKEEGESGAEQGLGCMCCLRKGTASRLLLSRIFLEWSGQKTHPPGRSSTKTTQLSHSDFHQLFPIPQVRFSCGSTPAEGNWEQPTGNEAGQGGIGVWDLHVPALGGHIPTPQDTAQWENTTLTSVISTSAFLRLVLRTLGSGTDTWKASAKTGVQG